MMVLYSGRVQGVGFRYTARSVAAGFEVCGTVRNLPDAALCASDHYGVLADVQVAPS